MGLIADLIGRASAPRTFDLGEASRRAAVEAEVSALDAEWARLEQHVRGVAPRVIEPFRVGWVRALAGWRRYVASSEGRERAALDAWRQVHAIWDALLHSPHGLAFEGQVEGAVGEAQEDPARGVGTSRPAVGRDGIPWWGVSAATVALAAAAAYAVHAARQAIERHELERARRIVDAADGRHPRPPEPLRPYPTAPARPERRDWNAPEVDYEPRWSSDLPDPGYGGAGPAYGAAYDDPAYGGTSRRDSRRGPPDPYYDRPPPRRQLM